MRNKINKLKLLFSLALTLTYVKVIAQDDINKFIKDETVKQCKQLKSDPECSKYRATCQKLIKMSPDDDGWDELSEQLVEAGLNGCMEGGYGLGATDLQKQKELEEQKRKEEEERKRLEAERKKLNQNFQQQDQKNKKDISTIGQLAENIDVNSTSKKKTSGDDLFEEEGPTKTKSSEADKYLKQRLATGKIRNQAWSEKVGNYISSNSENKCSMSVPLNVNFNASQNFTEERAQFSNNKAMRWSVPTKLPGSNIEVQYSLLFYCKVPGVTLGDKMDYVINDYGFIRLFSKDQIKISGKIEYDFIDFDGKESTSSELFYFDPAETPNTNQGLINEDIGMWHLGCKMLRFRIVRLQCFK